MNILEIENLKKTYFTSHGETLTIDDLSLSLKEGEFIAIVGPSGCGKSTLLSILCNLEKSTSGKISFPNKEKAKIGYMLQQDSLFPWLNILDNCLIGLKIQNNVTEENTEYVKSLLKNYGLEDFMYSYPNNLSGGMRQRVALIRTLASNPTILLLDEPFSALDYQTRLTLSNDIHKILKQENKSVIMVTHDLAEAISLSDIIIVFSKIPATVKNIYNISIFYERKLCI